MEYLSLSLCFQLVCVSLALKWVSCRKHLYYGACVLSISHPLSWTGAFSLLSLLPFLMCSRPSLYLSSCGRAFLPFFRSFSEWVALHVFVTLVHSCEVGSGSSYSAICPVLWRSEDVTSAGLHSFLKSNGRLLYISHSDTPIFFILIPSKIKASNALLISYMRICE